MIHYRVSGQRLSRANTLEILASDQIAFAEASFALDASWASFDNLFAQFDQPAIQPVAQLLVDGRCVYPAELQPGPFRVTLVGYRLDGTRATTNAINDYCYPSGFRGNVPPSPDLYAQLLRKIQDASANTLPMIGANGTWLLWDPEQETRVDSGIVAVGTAGELDKTLSLPNRAAEAAAVGAALNLLSKTIPAPYDDSDIKRAVAAKYTKPSGGIPVSDLAPGTIPEIPKKITAFENDAGYAKETDLSKVAKTGSYNDLTGKPAIPDVPASLPNPQPLTFTGAATGSYDGSSPLNINIPQGGSVELDDTLSEEGKAAEAKAVGDAINDMFTVTPGDNVKLVTAEDLENEFEVSDEGKVKLLDETDKEELVRMIQEGGNAEQNGALLVRIVLDDPETEPEDGYNPVKLFVGEGEEAEEISFDNVWRAAYEGNSVSVMLDEHFGGGTLSATMALGEPDDLPSERVVCFDMVGEAIVENMLVCPFLVGDEEGSDVSAYFVFVTQKFAANRIVFVDEIDNTRRDDGDVVRYSANLSENEEAVDFIGAFDRSNRDGLFPVVYLNINSDDWNELSVVVYSSKENIHSIRCVGADSSGKPALVTISETAEFGVVEVTVEPLGSGSKRKRVYEIIGTPGDNPENGDVVIKDQDGNTVTFGAFWNDDDLPMFQVDLGSGLHNSTVQATAKNSETLYDGGDMYVCRYIWLDAYALGSIGALVGQYKTMFVQEMMRLGSDVPISTRYHLERKVDQTLSKSGAAADAKATGDKLNELKEELSDKEPLHKVLSATLVTGQTQIVFTDDAISDNAMLYVYTTKWGVNPSDVVQDGNTITLTFDVQSADLGVKLEVR